MNAFADFFNRQTLCVCMDEGHLPRVEAYAGTLTRMSLWNEPGRDASFWGLSQ